MKIKFLAVFLFVSISLIAQNNSKYKYAIVPSNFSFVSEPNKYNLNSLTKSFFESQGFEVFYDNDKLTNEVAKDNCNKLFVEVTQSKSLFITKLTVIVKDCENNILITSMEGTSREKAYNVAFTQALRQALNSLKGLVNFDKRTSDTSNNADSNPKIDTKKEEVFAIDAGVPDKKKEIVSNYKLSAVPNDSGFKLVNSNLGVIFELLKTSKSDVFIVNGKKGGIVSVLNSRVWKYDYYENGKLVTEVIEILNL